MRHPRDVFAVWPALLAVAASCESRHSPTPTGEVPTTSTSLVASQAMNGAVPTTPATTAPAARAVWSGTFTVARHRIERPSLQAAWLKDDGSRFVGSGTLSVVSDASGGVLGKMDGPLGSLHVVGTFADGRLDARIEPERATASAFSGFLHCPSAQRGTKLDCELMASTGDGNFVRKGEVSLKPDTGEEQ